MVFGNDWSAQANLTYGVFTPSVSDRVSISVDASIDAWNGPGAHFPAWTSASSCVQNTIVNPLYPFLASTLPLTFGVNEPLECPQRFQNFVKIIDLRRLLSNIKLAKQDDIAHRFCSLRSSKSWIRHSVVNISCGGLKHWIPYSLLIYTYNPQIYLLPSRLRTQSKE